MHNGLLSFVGEKMSKSLGNVVTLHDAVERWGRETLLLFFMTAHWSKPMDFSDETMAQARAQVETFRNSFRSRGPSGRGRAGTSLRRWTMISTRRRRWPAARAGAAGRLGSAAWARIFGLGALVERERGAGRGRRARASSARRRGREGIREADRLRAEIEALGWEVQDVRATGFELVPKRDGRAGLRAPRRAGGGARPAPGARAATRASGRSRPRRGSGRRPASEFASSPSAP